MKNKISSIDHVNFSVNNFNESVEWYGKVFNFDLVEEGTNDSGSKWGILRSGDSMLAITELPEKTFPKGDEFHQTYHFGISVQDQGEWEETIKANSLKTFYSSPISYPHSTSWYVKDPTGHEVEVSVWDNNTVNF